MKHQHIHAHPIARNPLMKRADMQQAVQQICEPLQPYFSDSASHIVIGQTTAHYGWKTAGMETFSRPLWGIAPLLAGGGSLSFVDQFVKGIENGTNPQHRGFWGDVADYDQRIVEMAALGLSLGLDRDVFWSRLSEAGQQHLYQWLSQVNQRKTADNNWHLFRVLVNSGFCRLGLPFDETVNDWSLDQLERFYLGDGWYADGETEQRDYYISFAIHYYCLIYAVMMKEQDPERSQLYKERAALFAEDFIYWFASDGSAFPFGRSMTYRFAQTAFWSALAYAEVDVFSYGVMKGIIMRHLRWWMAQPIFDHQGLLTIGYGYPQLIMSENYNAPGSPYWALKAFLVLALDETHPFWQADEAPLPELYRQCVQKQPGMIVNRDSEGKHVYALTSGQYAQGEFEHTPEKYSKFAYSNVFGFNVSKDAYGLVHGAFDSTLALSEQDGYYRMRRTCKTAEVAVDNIYALWRPWRDVEVETWLIPVGLWHVRLHHIKNQRVLDTAEGGFSVAKGEPSDEALSASTVAIQTPYGISGIVSLLGQQTADLVTASPNTNVLFSECPQIPTLTSSLAVGDHWLASAILAHTDAALFADDWQQVPYFISRPKGYDLYAGSQHFFIATS